MKTFKFIVRYRKDDEELTWERNFNNMFAASKYLNDCFNVISAEHLKDIYEIAIYELDFKPNES